MSETAPEQAPARDAAYWAKAVSTLQLGEVPPGAINLNVNGKQLVGPIQGFGRMWQRTYRVELHGAEVPAEVISAWKQRFATFWPRRGRFYGPATAIAPGDVALLNLNIAAGVQLATGVMVLYADEESFTFMNPQGHMFAGWITFSAAAEGGTTVAQAQVLVRANDPLYELAMPLGLSRIEDRFWQQTLRALAAHFGVEQATVQTSVVCVDRRRQWANARNLRHNAGVRSVLYAMATPVRLAVQPLRARRRVAMGDHDAIGRSLRQPPMP
jgi:hypothetical protein